MLGKDGLEASQSADGVDVAHDAHHHDRGGLKNGDRLYLLTLGLLCCWREAHQGPIVQQNALNKACLYTVKLNLVNHGLRIGL